MVHSFEIMVCTDWVGALQWIKCQVTLFLTKLQQLSLFLLENGRHDWSGWRASMGRIFKHLREMESSWIILHWFVVQMCHPFELGPQSLRVLRGMWFLCVKSPRWHGVITTIRCRNGKRLSRELPVLLITLLIVAWCRRSTTHPYSKLLLSEWISIPSQLIVSVPLIISVVIYGLAHHQILLDFGLISIHGVAQGF